MLCSIIKHSGSGESTQEVGRNTHLSARVSPYTSFVFTPPLVCFITEQSTVEAFLFVKLCMEQNPDITYPCYNEHCHFPGPLVLCYIWVPL